MPTDVAAETLDEFINKFPEPVRSASYTSFLHLGLSGDDAFFVDQLKKIVSYLAEKVDSITQS